MRKLQIALVLIEQEGKYLLQLRGSDPKIGGAGLIGCFGGKIEPNETPEQAARRELGEETSFDATSHEFTHLGEVQVHSDHQLEPVHVTAQVYRLLLDEVAKIEAKEGELVHIVADEVKNYLEKMTTGARACFETLVLQEQE